MPKPYSRALKEAVVETGRAEGVTAAANKHGVSKGAVSKWMHNAGVQTVQAARTAKATEAHANNAEQRRAAVGERLWEIADKASIRELELIRASRLRDVVGARTRAIHDAELLAGRATARTENVEPIDVELQRLAEEVRAR